MHPFKYFIMMINALSAGMVDALPASLLCILFVLSFALLSLAGLYAFNLLKGHRKLPQNNDVAGIIFGAISLIYSLILAFVIVAGLGKL